MEVSSVHFKGSVRDLVDYVRRFLESFEWPDTIGSDLETYDLSETLEPARHLFEIREDRGDRRIWIVSRPLVTPDQKQGDGVPEDLEIVDERRSFLVAAIDMVRVTEGQSELSFKVIDWVIGEDELARAMDETMNWDRWPSSEEDRERVVGDCRKVFNALLQDIVGRGLAVGQPSGDQRQLPSAALGEKAPTGRYVFRKTGEVWEIQFTAEGFSLRDLIGLGYIAYLLGRPNKEFHIMDLVAAVEQRTTNARTDEHDIVDSLSRVDWGAGESILDKKAHDDYRTRLAEIDEEIENATILEDDQRVGRLQDEKEKIMNELKASTGLRGKPRSVATPKEFERQRVKKNISYALKAILKHDPPLHRHLESCISTGSRCCYRPPEGDPASWIT